jgi:predicted restriction endonuclease
MSLSIRDKKFLWTRAGNCCSYRYEAEICNEELAILKDRKKVLIGEECHIVGKDSTKPRYIDDFPERETYDNRILLCRNHHKMIDDNEDIYSSEVLKEMKKEHEDYIAERFKNKEIEPMVIKNSEFEAEAKDVEEVTVMEIKRPTQLSNVKAKLKAENVKKATVLKTNQTLNISMNECKYCNNPLPSVTLGFRPSSVICKKCGRENKLGNQ